MDKLNPAILESFGILSRSIKKERGHYLCFTDSGLMKVHITSDSPEVIWLQYSVKEHLAAKGFGQTDRFQLTKSGQPFVVIGRETYVVTKLPDKLRETDFESETEVLQAFMALAHFHIAACNMPQSTVPKAQPLPEIYTRQINELTQIGKQARRGSRFSDFDVLFINHAPHYYEIVQDSINRLSKTDYTKLHTEAINQSCLCHSNLKEENLLAMESATYITNFANIEIDLQLNDVAALIRRYTQRSSKLIPISRLLETYDRVNPLPYGAVDILYAMLIFPWTFLKICTQYYSKKRNWTPNGMISRMETILAERESHEIYISHLL